MRKIIGFRTLCVGLGIWVGTVGEMCIRDRYKGPEDYYNDTKNKREIVFFGEERCV